MEVKCSVCSKAHGGEILYEYVLEGGPQHVCHVCQHTTLHFEVDNKQQDMESGELDRLTKHHVVIKVEIGELEDEQQTLEQLLTGRRNEHNLLVDRIEYLTNSIEKRTAISLQAYQQDVRKRKMFEGDYKIIDPPSENGQQLNL